MLPYKMDKLCSKLQHIKELFYSFTVFIHDGPSICYIYIQEKHRGRRTKPLAELHRVSLVIK